MRRRPPRSTRTDPLFPDPSLFRSRAGFRRGEEVAAGKCRRNGLRLYRGRRGIPGGVERLENEWMERKVGKGQSKRSEEHTSELQSLMRISYAVFCLKKKKQS